MPPPVSELPLLAPSEWILMRCVWDLGSANALEVAEHMSEHYKREEPMLSPSTVGILLSRLVAKGYLRFHLGLVPPGGGRSPHIYSPLVPFEPVMRAQIQRFLDDSKLEPEMVAEVLDSFLRKAEQEAPPPPRESVFVGVDFKATCK